ncbi:MAG TPA: OmpH family outer membrane protein [Halomonas sp.]|nr:OmpH family outer membrane protein [Halomonas sp.]
MRKLTAAICLGLLGALAQPVMAAEVATLDWRKALLDTSAARQSMNQFRNQISASQQEIERLGPELDSMQQRFQSGQPSDAEMREFQRKAQRFEQLRMEILQARQQAEQRFLDGAEEKMNQAVDQVIERHAIDVLVDPGGVLHSRQQLPDMTAEVTQIIESLN